MPKYIEAWTTEEIYKLITEVWRSSPNTVRDYKQGWDDALQKLRERIEIEIRISKKGNR